MNEEVIKILANRDNWVKYVPVAGEAPWTYDSYDLDYDKVAQEIDDYYRRLFPKTIDNPTGYESPKLPRGIRCPMKFSHEHGKWIPPEDFIEDGLDICVRKTCGFFTCHNFGKGFGEYHRLIGFEP